MACEECGIVKDVLIRVLMTLDWAFFGGKMTPGDRYRLRAYQDINEIGAPIHEALLKLKGETKPSGPKRAVLSPETAAVLCSNGELVFQLGHPIYRKVICLSPDEAKRLASFLKDGE